MWAKVGLLSETLTKDSFDDLSMARSGVAAMAAFLTSQYGLLQG